MPIGTIIGLIIAIFEAIVGAITAIFRLIIRFADFIFLGIAIWFLVSTIRVGQELIGIGLLLVLLFLIFYRRGLL